MARIYSDRRTKVHKNTISIYVYEESPDPFPLLTLYFSPLCGGTPSLERVADGKV